MLPRHLAPALLLCLLAGCARPRADAASIGGTWRMVSIRGHAPPPAGHTTSVLVSRSLELAPDSQFLWTELWSGHYRGSTAPRPPGHFGGRYRLHADTVLLDLESGVTAPLLLDRAGRLTLRLGGTNGEEWVYRRDPR